jgi:peptidyl-prolyl cis-trans isomerase D
VGFFAMMQAIRGRAGSLIVKILFGLLIISFGLWGVADYLHERTAPDTVVARVGDETIRADEVQRELQPMIERMRAQFGGTIDAQQLKQFGVVDTLLGQLIDRKLLHQEVRRLGLEVPDEVVRSAIYDNPAFRGPDGRFDRQAFAQVLMMHRLTEDQLVARLRGDIPRSDLLQAITAGAAAPQPVVDALYRYRNEKRVADIVSFPVSAVTDVGQPSEGELTKYYEAHSDLFQAPEFRAFTLATLSPADVKSTAEIPEAKLRREYEERKDEYDTPEQRQIQQILAPTEEKAKEVEAALQAGKDWQEVATNLAAQDPETMDLGLLSRKDIPRELGDVAFELPLNQPSEPVKTPFGWHILRVVKIEPGATPSFEQARPKLVAELQLQDAIDRLAKMGNQADDALAAGGKIDEVAPKFGLKLTTVASVDEGGNDPEGKRVNLPVPADEVLKVAFTTGQGETSRIADMQDGSIYAVRIDKVSPPHVKPLDEVRALATAGWQAEQKHERTAKDAEALAAASGPDKPLAKVAADKGLTVMPAVTLSRTPQQGQTVSPALVAKLFAAKPGDVVTVGDASGGYTAQLKEVQVPESVPEADAARLAQQVAGEVKQDIAGEYTEALRKRYPVEIKRKELDRLFCKKLTFHRKGRKGYAKDAEV